MASHSGSRHHQFSKHIPTAAPHVGAAKATRSSAGKSNPVKRTWLDPYAACGRREDLWSLQSISGFGQWQIRGDPKVERVHPCAVEAGT